MEMALRVVLMMILLMIIVGGDFDGAEGVRIIPKTAVVQIKNQLPGNVSLTVHCKSKQDDLGIHVLSPNGGSWAFSFKPDVIFLLTQFYCSFQWPPSNFKYYDVYIEDRDYHRCSKCFWDVHPEGPCLFNWDTLKYDCDHWN